MGIFSTLNVGASGMRVNEEAIAIIGDNIANLNTVGYKGSRGVFADILNRTILGSAGPSELGQGASLSGIERLHRQGALLGTGVSTDLAIGGDGFFMVDGEANGGDGRFYTRNGQFHIDSEGRLVDVGDRRVQGYMAGADGTLGSQLGDLAIEPRISPPEATTAIGLTLNLSFDVDPAATADFGGLDDPASVDPLAVPPQGDYTTTVDVHDAAGAVHTLDVYFIKNADGTWDWQALALTEELAAGGPDHFTVVSSGTLTFQDGLLQNEGAGLAFNVQFTDVSGQDITLDFGDAIDDGGNGTGTGSVAGDSAILGLDVDGRAAGDFQFLQFLADGSLIGTYSNGDERVIGAIALAEFTNATGLDSVGNNLFKLTEQSGDAVVGTPNSGSRGELFGGALEGSSVDLTEEFTHMIMAQRGFQASSRTIVTADAMLTEVLNLKR